MVNEHDLVDILLYRHEGYGSNLDPETKEKIIFLRNRKQFILLPFAPKTAGTFLRNMIAKATDGRLVSFTFSPKKSARDLYLPAFVRLADNGPRDEVLIAHQHTFGFPANVQLIRLWNIKCLYVTRPIIDSIKSLQQMVVGGWESSPPKDKGTGGGMQMYVDKYCLDMSEAELKSYFMRSCLPWYLNYHMSWISKKDSLRKSLTIINYEDFSNDDVQVTARVLAKMGFERSIDDIAKIKGELMGDPEKVRFNKGQHGTGRDFYSREDIKFYEQYLEPFKEILIANDIY